MSEQKTKVEAAIDATYLVTPKQLRHASTRRSNRKVEEIRGLLRALALEKGPGRQLPTIRELCTLFNTSSATLTAALDLLETENIIHRKERQGIFVATSINRKNIHVLFNASSLSNVGQSPFWSILLANLLKESEQHASFKNEQYHFHFLWQPHGQTLSAEYINLLKISQADACILIGANARYQDHTSALQIPHVTFAGGGDITVQVAFQESDQQALHWLVQQGCKKIACIEPIYRTQSSESCQKLFQRLLPGLGLSAYPELFRQASILPSPYGRELTYQEQGYMVTKELFTSFREHRPDGMYIADDMMASGALVAWEELGLRPGVDIKIISHVTPGSPILFGKTRAMATIEIEPIDIVRALFSLLDTAMASDYKPDDVEYFIRPRLRPPSA